MIKKVGIALVVVFSLLGCYSAYSFGRQLVTDYQNFRKIVIWVAQKQQQEEFARQRAQQQPQAPVTPPAAADPSPEKK